ncbi:hypothetical protein [Streptomyces sp. NPDC056323]|uniref:hypothetical protein n=1 Tax=unclassified Streptomyces TaxID=2593676 RepID=UPI0035DD9989
MLDHHAYPIAGVPITFPGDAADEAECHRIVGHVARTVGELTRRVGGVAMG